MVSIRASRLARSAVTSPAADTTARITASASLRDSDSMFGIAASAPLRVKDQREELFAQYPLELLQRQVAVLGGSGAAG
jgi:hypothetical protein